jgi:fatty-acid peroxygenase
VRRPGQTLALATQGYAWLPDLRRATGRRTVTGRLAGLPVVGIVGPDAARFLYDEAHVRRAHALPEPVQGTLFGKGAVHSKDGEEHRARKAVFVSLLMGGGIGEMVERTAAAWDAAAAGWAGQDEVVLFRESARVLARAVCDWTGVPLADAEVPALADDLQAMVDGFATAGPRHWRARRARGRRERWLAGLVDGVRDGSATAPAGSVLEVVARHRGLDGELLSPHDAAVEVLNVLRPTVAISWFVAYSAHAMVRWPETRERLRAGDAAYAEAFAHEVRRFYPFAPFIGGRAPARLEFDGVPIPRNAMVFLDLWGQDHDPELFPEPYAFRPERFLRDGAVRPIGPFELVPQGGGDPRTNHRCPGELLTVAVLAVLATRLARLGFDVPEQDLSIPLDRIPSRVRSGVVLHVHG